MMGGTFDNSNISVVDDDNFHRVQSVAPVHLPSVDTECDKNIEAECPLNSITVSENKYDFLDQFDSGYYPIAASEIKTKLNSRQRVQQKYVTGDDMGPYNEGPLWIWTYMDYKT